MTLPALNDLEVQCGNVLNAYITAPVEEKSWTTLGPEFGADSGKRALIVCDFYGLKSAGAAFCAHLGKFMKGLGYEPCLTDPNLWMKPEIRPDDHYEYYSYILCYVDNIMVVHHEALSILERIDKYFTLKPTSIGEEDIYLGAKLCKMNFPNVVWCWIISPSK